MQPLDQRQQTNITPHPGGHLVQVGDKTYYLTELQMTGASTLITPQPIERSPHEVTPDDLFLFWVKLLAIGTLGLGGLLALLVCRDLFFRPPPVPIAAPAAAPQPQTVIVQPAPPERRPYLRRDCRATGLFGWGSECQEEQGYE